MRSARTRVRALQSLSLHAVSSDNRIQAYSTRPPCFWSRLKFWRTTRDRLYAARPPAGSGGGLKWQTWQTFAIPKSRLSSLKSGGREGIRTPGLLVANEALSQLSYSPTSSNKILADAPNLAN